MRYPASDKAEIIRLVEQSHLPVRRTLEKLGLTMDTRVNFRELERTGVKAANCNRAVTGRFRGMLRHAARRGQPKPSEA